MAKSNISLLIDAKDGEAVQSFLRLTTAERNLELQTRRTGVAMREKEQASRRAGAAALNSARAGLSFVAGFAGISSATGAIMALTRELKSADEAMANMARRANEKASTLVDFSALQAEGAEGRAHVARALLKGARAGVGVSEAAAMATPIQSVVDADGDGRLNEQERADFDEDFGAALDLNNLNVSAEDAQTVITSGRARGQGGQESADKFIAAASTSGANPGDFAKSASALAQFEDSDAGLAILSALTREEKNFGRLPTMLRNLGGILGESADGSDFSKKFGLAGKGELEKVQALRQHAIDTGDQSLSEEERIRKFSKSFESEGLSKREAEGLGIAVRQGDFAAQVQGQLGELEAGVTERKLASIMEDPGVRAAKQAAQAKALAEAATLYGPESEDARENLKGRLAVGADRLAEGDSRRVNIESGEAGLLARVADFVNRANISAGTGPGGMPAQAEVERRNREIAERPRDNDERVVTAMERLAGVLEANIAATEENSKTTEANSGATEENTGASRGRAPVGGALSNAEEKY
jgi:hypothetical protein